jgi:hypothetical protein
VTIRSISASDIQPRAVRIGFGAHPRHPRAVIRHFVVA